MKKIIRLTENDLHTIITNAIKQCLKEDGALGGATSCAGIYDTPSSSGSYENGNAQKKQVTDIPFGGKPLKQKHNLGKKNDDFFGETTKRHNGKGGSISIPKKRA